MKTLTAAISLLLLTIVLTAGSTAQEYREWTTSDGKFTVEAKLNSQTEDAVTIVKRDGTEVTVPMDRLSEADRKYANSNPFKSNGSAKPKTRPKTGGSIEIEIPETEIWNVTPDPFTGQAELGADLIDYDDKDASPHSQSIILSRDRKNLFLFEPLNVRFVPDEQKSKSLGQTPVRMRSFDLDTGHALDSPPVFMPKCLPLDISPDKSRFLVSTSDRSISKYPMIHVFETDGPSLIPLASWLPYKELGWGEIFLSAYFIDNDHVMTVASSGLVGLWDIRKLKLVWSLQVWPTSEPGLSPNRKLLFARVEKGLAAIEILTGQVVGLNFCDEIGMNRLSVNDSCKRLVGIGAGICFEWDLSNGDLISSFAVSPQLRFSKGHPESRFRTVPIEWVGERQFLATSSSATGSFSAIFDLIDLDAQCSTWVYSLKTIPAKAADGRIWTRTSTESTKENPPNLRSFRLPHEAAEIAIEDAKSNSVVNFEANSNLPYRFSVEDSLWTNPEEADENARLKLSQLGFSVQEVSDNHEESEPFFDAALLASHAKDGQKPILMGTDALFSIRYLGELLWKNEALWISNPSFQQNPWEGKLLPRSFRFYKPQLDSSVLRPDGSVGNANYERKITPLGLGGGSSTSQAKDQNPERSPGLGGSGSIPRGRSGWGKGPSGSGQSPR